MFRTNTLAQGEIYGILANGRRRETLRHLTEVGNGIVTLEELTAAVAATEAGGPPQKATRESVRSSLHQTHLPKLESLGVVTYDREAKTVTLCPHAREVDRYMDVVTGVGLTWGELYRSLGIGSLLIVLAALLELPLVSAVDPLLWVSVALGTFAVAVGSQLWSNRWYVRRALSRKGPRRGSSR